MVSSTKSTKELTKLDCNFVYMNKCWKLCVKKEQNLFQDIRGYFLNISERCLIVSIPDLCPLFTLISRDILLHVIFNFQLNIDTDFHNR